MPSLATQADLPDLTGQFAWDSQISKPTDLLRCKLAWGRGSCYVRLTVKFIIAQSNIESRLCRKKTKWWTDLPEGIVCPIPLTRGRVLKGRG